jgi:hypothetical protein
MIAALGGKRRQVSPAHVAVDPPRRARVSRPRTQIDRRSPFPLARCARVSRPRTQVDRRSPLPLGRCARVSRPRTQVDRRSPFPPSVFVSAHSAHSAVKSPFALASAISCPSQPSVTTTSLLSNTRYSPRAAFNPWLIAAAIPRLVTLVITVTGTDTASRTLSRYADVSSLEPSSMTIISHGHRV